MDTRKRTEKNRNKDVILYKLAKVPYFLQAARKQNANEGKRPDSFALVFEPIKGVEGVFSHQKYVRLTHPR